MEEVWKELSLASLDHHAVATSATDAPPPPTAIGGLTLQEFLASPFNSTPSPSSSSQTQTQTQTLSNPHPQKKTQSEKTPSSSSSNGLISFCVCPPRKRGPPGDDGNASDRKKKRLMKNRESAARSRARKQAYTHELELEVAHLMEENTKLKRQQEQLCAAAANGDLHQKKHKLHRTLTAPF